MESIIFNSIHSGINLQLESYALRAAYLLSETVVTAGTSYYFICYDHYSSTVSLYQKIAAINNYQQRWGSDDAAGPQLEEFRRVSKAYNKIKFHPSQGIILKKKFEQSTDVLYKIVVSHLRTIYCGTGLPQLEPVFTTDDFLAYPVSSKDAEIKDGDMLPASKLLQLDLPEEFTPPHIFFLKENFFEHDFIKDCKVVETSPVKQKDADTAYLQPLFTFPNLNFLSATELQTIRGQLRETAQPFQQKINEWARMVKEQDKNSISYFFNEVCPASVNLRESINANDLLKLCSRQRNDELIAEILFGEMPVKMIWNYYKHFNIIREETWKALQAALEQDFSASVHWPVILFRDRDTSKYQPRVNQNQEKVTAVKKSLIVD